MAVSKVRATVTSWTRCTTNRVCPSPPTLASAPYSGTASPVVCSRTRGGRIPTATSHRQGSDRRKVVCPPCTTGSHSSGLPSCLSVPGAASRTAGTCRRAIHDLTRNVRFAARPDDPTTQISRLNSKTRICRIKPLEGHLRFGASAANTSRAMLSGSRNSNIAESPRSFIPPWGTPRLSR